MDQLTDAGKGAHVFLPNLDEVELMFGDYFSKMVEVAADEISIAMTFPPGIRLESFSGEEVSTDRENRVQNIILAKGDDLTFLARLLVSDDEAWDKPATLEIEYRPLGTAELVTQKVQFEKLSEILKPEGQLMQRTQAVVDFADYACGTGSDTEAKRTLENYETNHTLDWGLEEIQSLLR